jgi:hypothetical protein
MANSPVTPQWVINEVGRELLNKVILIKKADRTYDKQFEVKGAKVGSIVNARLPQRYRVGSGAAINKQGVNDQTTPVEITDQSNIGIELSSWVLTLEKSEIRKNVIQPAVNALVQDMEYKGFSRLYEKVANSAGTLGTSPTANLTYTQAVAKLGDLSGNTDELCAIVSNDQMVIADAQKSYFTNVINPAFAMGKLPRATEALGIKEWYASPNVARHTSGTFTASTPLVNVAGGVLTDATSVVTDGWASGATTLKKGDVFTFANVFEINSSNYQSTGRLRQFTLTADVSDSAGAATLNFTPAVKFAANGQFNNVNSLPANNAAITVWSADPAGGTLATTTSAQGLIFQPESFVFCMADAEKVDSPVCVFARDEEAGISLRLTKSYDINNDNNLARIDAFWGWSAIRPEWTALRVQGA